MGALSFNLGGLNEVLQSIKNLAAEAQTVADDELTATAYDIVRDAQAAAPVDLGNLRANIGVTGEGLQRTVFSGAEYSAYQEFGTGGLVDIPEGPGFEELAVYASQFKGADKRKVNVPAHPYFFPSIQKNTIEMVERLKKQLNA